MAAELGLLSMTQLQKLAQHQKIEVTDQRDRSSISNNNNNNTINYWMWNPRQQKKGSQDEEEEEDSWEVKAFEQDTGNNITWPPRSYTCTFCRREFRSAQALGGHMNVHRRDRARLHHQTVPNPISNPTAVSSSSSSTTTTTLLIPAQDFGGGLCVLYSLPNPKVVTGMNSCMDSPSTPNLLSISPFESNNLVPTYPPPPLPLPTTTYYPNFPVTVQSNIINPSSNCHESCNTEPSASNISNDNGEFKMKDSTNEELDLELRLGRR